MKTVDFKAFAKDVIREKELNYLKGGFGDGGGPIDDLLTPPRK